MVYLLIELWMNTFYTHDMIILKQNRRKLSSTSSEIYLYNSPNHF